ncbi:protein-L-isoaspartate O-methyltransferase family protein [Entomobacter blattae]|uniref:Protein-L-isoaspartate O-methyltransferase n=1 Tax=Entomobacter blattae TaxID=2762277 RepID=A0A7H1NT50_9PROT|nr:protein-L-isoaspartate O-methyltransferase [Entomobacter blattae]QNT78960.1 Protein-L-isoaspartate O-methyltransferase [Entomobacter blattae]
MLNFTEARQKMVDAQIRPQQINDPRIVSIMRHLPREQCTPDSLKDFSYIDGNLSLGEGRVLTEPRITGRMLQLSDVREGENVLVIAAGTGYVAAMFANLGAKVTAVEQNKELSALGEKFCKNFAPEVHWYTASFKEGFPGRGPYDLIYIDGAVQEIPPIYKQQLAPGGRIVGVIWPEGKVASAFLAEHSETDLKVLPQFDVSLPLLPELVVEPSFKL